MKVGNLLLYPKIHCRSRLVCVQGDSGHEWDKTSFNIKCTQKIKCNQSKKYRKKTLYEVLIIIQSVDGVQSGEKKLNVTIEESNKKLDLYYL